MRDDAKRIYEAAIQSALPGPAVVRALKELPADTKKLYLLAVGKAAWTMAASAHQFLGERIQKGIVITKEGHSEGPIGSFKIFEAGHPVVDERSIKATEEALKMAFELGREDRLIFLLSGGGSALFEAPELPLDELQKLNQGLLASGADIVSINMLRKRWSKVKGGQFGALVAPCEIVQIVLSDVLGDRLDSIASGPCAVDQSTTEEVCRVVETFGLELSPEAEKLLTKELPTKLEHVESKIVGSVWGLLNAAKKEAEALGYRVLILTDRVDCEAREIGRFLGSLAAFWAENKEPEEKLCFLLGGETVVHLKGQGKGGRNQELALAAAPYLKGLKKAVVFSVGSDGTDGPTDAAGGLVDTKSQQALCDKGLDLESLLLENDSYRALEAIGGLIQTGPTGTNVNDLSCLLLG